MKKIYFLALSMALGFSANAQFTDDFESYPLGPYFGGHWGNWSGTSIENENIIITNVQASSGSQSGFVGNNNIQDPILKLGNKTSGVWVLEWKMFIDFASTGYFNFQEDENISTGIWGLNFHFNEDGANPGVVSIQDDSNPPVELASFGFTEEEWITFRFTYDLNAGTVVVNVEGDDVYSGDAFLQSFQLGAVDFYSIDTSNSYYIDDIVFTDNMSVTDLTGASISVYPTVVKDNVNISAKSNITNVAVFNTAGQQVLKSNPNSVSTQVNMSALPAGVYIVKIQAGKETLTKKVVVK